MKEHDSFLRTCLEPGTPECTVFCGVLGCVIAFLLLFLGLWKTLFIVLFCVLGAFIGGVKQKGAYIKRIINKLFPPSSKVE